MKSEIKTTKTERNGRTKQSIRKPPPTTPTRITYHASTYSPFLSFPRSNAATTTNKLLSFGRLDSTLCLMNGIYNRRGGGGATAALERGFVSGRSRDCAAPSRTLQAEEGNAKFAKEVWMESVDGRNADRRPTLCVHTRTRSLCYWHVMRVRPE